MGKDQSFEEFLLERNDELDNAAHALAILMLSANETPPNEDEFPWNMEIIGAILESTENILESHGHPACWPYHEDEIPCIDTLSCKKEHRPLKNGLQKEATVNE